MSDRFHIKERHILAVIIFVAEFVRFFMLGRLPGGIAQDEAYAAYNAYGIMTEGMDSFGYRFPVYFMAWGDGMNVLYSYLVVPFFSLFGISMTVYRLPMAIMGVVTVFFSYLVGRELSGEKFGVFFAFIMAINPWNIVNSRWGLESNLAPALFLITVFFLLKAINKDIKYLIPAGIFAGLSLYAYAVVWLVLPLFLVCAAIVFRKKLFPKGIGRYHIIAGLLLFALALPLLLFVAVNMGIIPEIRTDIISIPRLILFRSNELDFRNIIDNLRPAFEILVFQRDSAYPQLTNNSVGSYYSFTTVFSIFGIACMLYELIKGRREEPKHEYIMLIWLAAAFIVCIIKSEPTVTHFNLLHIPMIFFGAYGIWSVGELVKMKAYLPIVTVFFSVSFIFFVLDYFVSAAYTSYNFVEYEIEDVLDYSKEKLGEEGHINIIGYDTLNYGILLYEELPKPEDFIQNADIGFMENVTYRFALHGYGKYRYLDLSSPEEISSEDIVKGDVYMFRGNSNGTFEDDALYEVRHFSEAFSVAYMK
ncbi:MAG: glycosyltransferase family 39 protein [Lachnospiraceae bacterium]|nr:glycosyltransferase family 39 protein [Lachnospiraceae bacterium]